MRTKLSDNNSIKVHKMTAYGSGSNNRQKYAILIFSIFLLLVMFPVLCSATDYYVSTSGDDDDDGTSDSPWATIQHAIDTVVAGDTINVRPGTYNVNQIDINKEVTLLSTDGADQTTIKVDLYGICIISNNVTIGQENYGFTFTASRELWIYIYGKFKSNFDLHWPTQNRL